MGYVGVSDELEDRWQGVVHRDLPGDRLSGVGREVGNGVCQSIDSLQVFIHTGATNEDLSGEVSVQ